ncbi:hypothetical protein PWR05_35200 [Paraburkholderia sp. A2RI-6]|uniref:hypothetical protein n=1 Tax=Paraburkholderia sp. A2RI-6 TaxID=3028371 RepID=UPI003B7FBB71
MAYIQGAVDTPPKSALPLVAVIVGPDGRRRASFLASLAEQLIADVLAAARKP